MEFRSSVRIAKALEEMGCDEVLVGDTVCDRDSRLGVPPQAELPDEPKGYISEDYSLLAARVRSHGGQSCYFKNLTACAAPIHDPRFDFPERALVTGVTAFAGLAASQMG